MRSTPVARIWYTTQQAADFLGVHQHTIQKWIVEGIVPAYRLPNAGRRNRWRIKHEDLAALLSRRIPPQEISAQAF